MCYSGYAETEVNAGDGILPAGTWIKDCAEKSYIQGISSQTDISNLALLRIYILIFANIFGPAGL